MKQSKVNPNVGKVMIAKGWYPVEFVVVLDVNYAWYKLKSLSSGAISNITCGEFNKTFVELDKSRRKDVL
jgi:hypothetical protein